MQVQSVWRAGSERHDWRVFLLQTCLTLAVLLLGGALICWVAANWSGWSRFERLTGAQAALMLVTLPAIVLLWRGRDRPAQVRSARSGLIGLACVALGALLALIGQTYQTGANTWELFALWAALMLPWAIAGRSASVWLLWVAVVNTALLLWHAPTSVVGEWMLLEGASVWMISFNLAALACWTACATATQADRRAGPRLLAALALAGASIALLNDDHFGRTGVLLWLWTALPLTLVYRYARPDAPILAMIVLSALSVAIRLVWTPFDDYDWALRIVLTIVVSLSAGVLGHRWIGHALRQPDARTTASAVQSRALGLALLLAALACVLITLAGMRLPDAQPATPADIAMGVVAVLALAAWVFAARRIIVRRLDQRPPGMHGAAARSARPMGSDLRDTDLRGTDVGEIDIRDTDLLHTDTPDARPRQAASLVQTALLAVTAWFAAILQLGLLLFVGLGSTEVVIGTAGPILALLGVVLVRAGSKSLFLKQVASALAFGGLVLVAADALTFGPLNWLDVARVVTISLAVYLASGYATMQLLATLTLAFGLVLLTWLLPANPIDVGLAMSALFNGPGIHALGAWTPASFALAALAVVLFLIDARTREGVRRFDPLPMAWGMALASLATAWFSAGVTITQLGNLWALHAPTALILAAGALLPALASTGAMWPVREKLGLTMRWAVPLGLLALGLLWLPSPGILFALCWTLLGFGLRRRGLLALGSVALIGYLCAYYYQLGVALLDKAVWLGLAGVLAALLALVLLRFHRRSSGEMPAARPDSHGHHVGTHASRPAPARNHGWRAGLALAGLVLALGLANTTIWQREQLIAHGQEIVLKLAPVDPRSLMQGDYMRLDFVLAREIAQQIEAAPANAPKGKGYAILSLLPNNEVRLLRLQRTPDNLASDEIALAYHQDDEIRIVTNAWFFEEGQGEHFEQSRYGVLRVDRKGRALLIEMRDEALKPL